MITYTIGEIYDNYIAVAWKKSETQYLPLPKGSYLYVYHHENTVFYVGRSIDPLDRLMQHLGKSISRPGYSDYTGDIIIHNMPDSGLWKATIYSLEDFLLTSEGKEAEWVSTYRQLTNHKPGWPHEVTTVSDLEERLINLLHPCLNRTNNRDKSSLPEKYRKQIVANGGASFFKQ